MRDYFKCLILAILTLKGRFIYIFLTYLLTLGNAFCVCVLFRWIGGGSHKFKIMLTTLSTNFWHKT